MVFVPQNSNYRQTFAFSLLQRVMVHYLGSVWADTVNSSV